MPSQSSTSINFVTATAYEQALVPSANTSEPKLIINGDVIVPEFDKQQEPANKIETDPEDSSLNKENMLNQNLEPMDCNPSPEHSPKLSSLDVPMIENSKDESNTAKSMTSVDSTEEMQTEVASLSETDYEVKSNMLTYEDLSLLVDLFYLPFEHGSQGVQILHEFHWLKSNGYIVSDYRKRNNSQLILSSEINEWYERASKFNETTLLIGRLLSRLTFCKNRSLLYELYPYVWDIKRYSVESIQLKLYLLLLYYFLLFAQNPNLPRQCDIALKFIR